MITSVSLPSSRTITINAEVQVLMACIDELRLTAELPPVTHYVSDGSRIWSDWESTLVLVRQKLR
jgi:hypothetical protein